MCRCVERPPAISMVWFKYSSQSVRQARFVSQSDTATTQSTANKSGLAERVATAAYRRTHVPLGFAVVSLPSLQLHSASNVSLGRPAV